MKKKKYYSEALMVIHQHMEAMRRLGAVTDEEMREFDEGCLVPGPDTAAAPQRAVSRQRAAAQAVTGRGKPAAVSAKPKA
jgi:putative transcriptional regulator